MRNIILTAVATALALGGGYAVVSASQIQPAAKVRRSTLVSDIAVVCIDGAFTERLAAVVYSTTMDQAWGVAELACPGEAFELKRS